MILPNNNLLNENEGRDNLKHTAALYEIMDYVMDYLNGFDVLDFDISLVSHFKTQKPTHIQIRVTGMGNSQLEISTLTRSNIVPRLESIVTFLKISSTDKKVLEENFNY